MCEVVKIIISVISPFVGIYGGYWIAVRSERRKSLQSIRAHVLDLIDDAERSTDDIEFYRESVQRLREPIYQSLAILGRQKGKKLHSVWSAYRNMRIADMTDSNFIAAVMSAIGTPTATRHDAIVKMLSYIEAEINDA